MRVDYRWLVRTARAGIGFGMVFAALGTSAWATQKHPEIDPGSMASALTLLTGGALILTGRKRKQ